MIIDQPLIQIDPYISLKGNKRECFYWEVLFGRGEVKINHAYLIAFCGIGKTSIILLEFTGTKDSPARGKRGRLRRIRWLLLLHYIEVLGLLWRHGDQDALQLCGLMHLRRLVCLSVLA